MMRWAVWAVLAAIGCAPSWGEPPPRIESEGGFISRNGGVEGRLGKSHIFLDATAGGVLGLVSGEWPKLTRIARLEARFTLRAPPTTAPLEVRQGFDRDAEVVFLEEGKERLGVRVRFKLYDAANVYHGHGVTEEWVYPNGEVFVACAASFENMAPAYANGAVTVNVSKITGAVQCAVPTNAMDRVAVISGALMIDCADTEKAAASVTPFDDAHLPGRFIIINPGSDKAVGVYWRSGKMAFNNYVSRPQGDSPTYYQWPSFLTQAYGGHGLRQIRTSDGSLALDWMSEGFNPGPNPEFVALFRLTAGARETEVKSFIAAEREPLKLEVTGGVTHGNQNGYNDQEGVYEVRKNGDPLRITIPGSAPGGQARIKVVGLSGHGGVRATLDGKPVLPQLSAEGGIADDPLAPIREAPEGPADMAVINAPITGTPRVLELREESGVQLVYQRKDPQRNLACFTSHGDGRYAAFRFSLMDGVMRNMRAHGKRDWALTENLMHWFSYCGFTPEQMLNQIREFSVTKNGPEEAEFRYVSRNANDGAESEFVVRVPDSPTAMQIGVKARFTVRENWPYPEVQFFDVFPFRGVWPRDWWYDEVLWVAPDGRAKWLGAKSRAFGGDKDLDTLTGPMFLAMHSSDRGNMVMLVHNFKPELPVRYVICGNYLDFHMDVNFVGSDGKNATPHKGDTISTDYQLALWGDGKTTREQLIKLGRASLCKGSLALDWK
ncbi:MAG: hypothetical protein HY360_04795 [Verrucomicrobia bacterium]|nr:hypothetical protein [Verrucomicrobiota bacterium]